jgi:HPt (histidine-containing phosphotransfer) domain-containing protein
MLAELQESMGDMAEELLPEIAPMLIEDAPITFAKLRQVINAGDALQVKELAHMLKGSCASMGIMALAGLCQEIEFMGRDNQLEMALTKLAQAEAEFEQVKITLSHYL